MDLQANAPYIQGLLQRYGFRNVRPSRNGFTASCPFHEDKHPSFSISRTGLWLCWSCKAAGNIKKLNLVMGGGEQDWKDSLKALGVQLRSNTFESKTRKKNDFKALPADFVPYPCEEKVPSIIAGRLRWNTIQHFQLGTSNEWRNRDRCVIPIIYKGTPVGYHGRALSNETQPRYYNPAGFDIKEHVFNFDACTPNGEVILVEGAFNAMSMWEKGYPNTMAVFGTKYTTAQIGRILSLNPSSVVVCFDRDQSKVVDGVERGKQGQKAAHAMGKILHDAVPVFIMPLPTGKDPNDLPSDTIAGCYDKRVTYEKLFGYES